MTARERQTLREAIRLIHADEDAGGDYHQGMNLLWALLGEQPTAIAQAAETVRPAHLSEITGRGNSTFGLRKEEEP